MNRTDLRSFSDLYYADLPISVDGTVITIDSGSISWKGEECAIEGFSEDLSSKPLGSSYCVHYVKHRETGEVTLLVDEYVWSDRSDVPYNFRSGQYEQLARLLEVKTHPDGTHELITWKLVKRSE